MEKTALKVLGLIPARGGSKGIPGKNIKPLAGKSLIERVYEVAIQSKSIDRIVLSTDDWEIAEHSKVIGIEVPFLRPAQISEDASPMIDVILHTLEELSRQGYEPDALLLLQPTSPMRQLKHIEQAIELLNDHDSVCSVIPIPLDLCPHYVMKIQDNGYLDYFLPEGKLIRRRQDVPQAYVRDGSIFLSKTATIYKYKDLYGEKCVPMLIDPKESLNIDTMEDWEKAEKILGATNER